MLQTSCTVIGIMQLYFYILTYEIYHTEYTNHTDLAPVFLMYCFQPMFRLSGSIFSSYSKYQESPRLRLCALIRKIRIHSGGSIFSVKVVAGSWRRRITLTADVCSKQTAGENESSSQAANFDCGSVRRVCGEDKTYNCKTNLKFKLHFCTIDTGAPEDWEKWNWTRFLLSNTDTFWLLSMLLFAQVDSEGFSVLLYFLHTVWRKCAKCFHCV